MASQKYIDRACALEPRHARHDTDATADGGTAAQLKVDTAAILPTCKEKMIVSGTPIVSSFETSVTTPSASSGSSSCSDVLHMKTPEFRPYKPCPRTRDVGNNESSGSAVKNLYTCLVANKSNASQVTGNRSREHSGFTSTSSVRKEYGPPILRKLREDPSLKNIRFDFNSSVSSEDDDDESVVKKKDLQNRISEESCPLSFAAERAAPIRPPTGASKKQPTCQPKHHIKEALNDLEYCTPLHPQKSEENHLTVRVNDKHYYIFSIIGSGGSSKVYDVYDDDKHSYAVKFVSLEGADERVTAMFLNEVTILKQLQKCERVVKLYDYEYCKKKKMLSLVMEKGETDLSGVLQSISHSNTLSPITLKFYWSEMLHAVKEIHEKGIIHSDLKPANFLLVKGKVKLIDFGIADTMQADVTSVIKSSQMGTLNYMSPESIMGTGEISQKTGRRELKINTKSDVWSLGCILYALVYGSSPFHGFASIPEKLHAITNDKHTIPFPEIGNRHLLDILQKCLQRNPKRRPTIAELLEHPYLTEDKCGASIMMKPELASLMSKIKHLSPASVQRVESFITTIQKK